MKARLFILALLSLTAACGGQGNSASPEADDQLVFMGRQIPDPAGAPDAHLAFDRPSREVEELSERIIATLALKPADRVADIGAGTGFYSLRIAPLVPSGRVFAVDVDPAMLDSVATRARADSLSNIVTVEGTVTDPGLDTASVDLALIVASYHEFTHPQEMLEGLFDALKPGGRLVIVEYRAEDETLPVPRLHRMAEAQLRREVESVGFEWRATRNDLPRQHLVIFARPVE